MAELTHWKKLHNPDYLGSYALQPGEEPVFTIKEVKREVVPDTNGKKEECTVVYFKEEKKPMVLNVTNAKTITKVTGSPFIEEWVGKRIQLFVDKIRAFGEDNVECLRVRPKAPPAAKPVLDESYKGWEAALAAVSKKETTVREIEKKYTLTAESKKALMEAENA